MIEVPYNQNLRKEYLKRFCRVAELEQPAGDELIRVLANLLV